MGDKTKKKESIDGKIGYLPLFLAMEVGLYRYDLLLGHWCLLEKTLYSSC